jgi:mRNA interferase MazF
VRGDIHRLRSDRRAKGREQQGARYAVVLQASYLPLATAIVAPTTTSTVGAAIWPDIEIGGTPTFVLVEQLMAVDLSRLGEVVGRVSPAEQELIDDRLRDVLNL